MFASFPPENIFSAYETFCTDKGICCCTKKAEENANHRTNVRLLDMLMEGTNYVAVGRHYGLKESSVCYIKKEESTEF